MSNSNGTMSSRLSLFAAGALAAGALLCGSPARAAQPTTVDEARAAAFACADRAALHEASAAAGAAFKAGLIQREQACAARYDALAAELAGETVVPPQSPEAEHYAEVAAHQRFIGGAAYKTGLVQEAEAQQRRYEAVPFVLLPESGGPNPICLADKPPVQLTCE